MISIQHVHLAFGDQLVFQDISFMIKPGNKIGLVGLNGAGKTTLLRMLLGRQQADEGSVERPGDLRFGYLPQHMDFTDGKSVYEEAKTAFKDILEQHDKAREMEKEIGQREDVHDESYLKLLDEFTRLNDHLLLLGIEDIDKKIELTLAGLGFNRGDFDKPTSIYSGGWRMRVELAKILLQAPDILLLDEPTNHLDIESIQWLENFIQTFPGALVLISHDRAFLDNVTQRTIELVAGKAYDYPVPYSQFVESRNERIQLQQAELKNRQKTVAETERFIERFRYKATKAAQVQSRVKQLERMEELELDEENQDTIHIRFPSAPRSGRVVCEFEGLSKSYGQHQVLQNLDMLIQRGEKIGFVGKNGEGKTTLARVMVGDLDYEGKFSLGHNVEIGYFAQNQEQLLDGEKTVWQTVDDVAVGDIRTKVRGLLGSFLFRGDDVYKKVKVLSGGEKSRLAMVTLLLKSSNLLVLDEPTNHLDMRSKDILKQALAEFDGTVVLVSHDREFMDGLVSKLYEFREKGVKEHGPSVYEFLKKRKIETLAQLDKKKATGDASDKVKKEKNKDFHEKKKNLERAIRKCQNQVNDKEKEINKIEKQVHEIEKRLAGAGAADSDQDIFKEYEELKQKLEKLLTGWEEAAIELEKWKEKLGEHMGQ